MRRATGLALATALLLAAGAATADAPIIMLTTKAGQAVKVRNHVKLGAGCTGGAPEIDFTPAPAHGKIDIRTDRFVLQKGFVSGALVDCEGRQVDGVAIWYTPDAGFHGVEKLTWTTSYGGGSRSHRVDTFSAQVTVQ
jgi:hypothetical protein